jgi:hypothetical protein
MAKFSKGPWRVVKTKRQGWAYEVRNGHRDPICVVYSSEADARLIAAALNLLNTVKHLIAIVRMHEGELRASERAKYEAARALLNELEGN